VIPNPLKGVHLAVKEAYDAGLCIVPPKEDGSKAPETYWKEFQTERASIEILRDAYRNGRTGLGLVCGRVSGELECLDFDTKDIYALFRQACGDAGLDGVLEVLETGYSEATPHGFHLLYRTEKCGGCTKLAREPKPDDETGWNTLIEVKAEGGYVIVAPSCGGVNKNGPYVRLSGSAATIPFIAMEDRDALFRVARSLDRVPVRDDIPFYEPKDGQPNGEGNRPGDDFIRRGSWDFLSKMADWTKVADGRDSEGRPQEYWRRPGKDQGNSAILHPESGLFYVFSSSTSFPEVPAAYNKFRTLVYTCFDGNFREAREHVESLGFEARKEEPPKTEEDGRAAPEAPSLIFRTALEVAAAVPEEVPWLCRPFFALGAITEIDGKAKKGGKTTFILAAVKSVITGGSFLDEPVPRSPVVFLSEQNDTTLRESLERAHLLEHPDLHIAQWAANRGFGWEAAVASARARCVALGAKMLVIDTLPQWAGIRGESENQSGPMLRAMEPLQVAAQAENLSVIVLRHDRKAGGEVGDSARGSSAIGGTVDVIIQIQRSGGNQQSLSALSRFDETPDSLVVLLREDGTYKALGDSDEVRLSGLEAGVLEILADADEPPTTAEIVVAKGSTDRQTIDRVLKRLMAKGRVMRVGEGKKGSPYRWKLWADV
jgi:hypothetical protein